MLVFMKRNSIEQKNFDDEHVDLDEYKDISICLIDMWKFTKGSKGVFG